MRFEPTGVIPACLLPFDHAGEIDDPLTGPAMLGDSKD